MRAATPSAARAVWKRQPVANPSAAATPALRPWLTPRVSTYTMSGPGAIVSTAAATRKRAMSGMSRLQGPGNEKAPCEDGALSGRKEPLGLRRLDAHGVLLLGT